MEYNRKRIAVVLAAAALCVPIAAQAQRNLEAKTASAPVVAAEKRVALVIGNAAYQRGPLKNPVNDARAIAARLQQLGFIVIRRENLKAKDIGPTLREFRSRLTAGATALFFYAGHGMQVRGANYLPAVDADIDAEEDVPTQSLNLSQVLELMEDMKARVNLVFLDACRDNPFARKFRSGSRGLARVDTTASGVLISFATRPGSVAADGDGRNGLYTEYLLQHMETPGLPIEQVLKRVGADVKLASKGRQEPWSEGLIEGDFIFRAGEAQAYAPAPPAVQVATVAPTRRQVTLATADEETRRQLQSAEAAFDAGRYAEFIRIYRGMKTRSIDGNWNLAIALAETGEYGAAIGEMRGFMQIRPGTDEALASQLISRWQDQLGDPAELLGGVSADQLRRTVLLPPDAPRRSRIGVVIQELTRDLAASFGLAKPMGALVNGVEPGSPGDKAGLEAADVVLMFGGHPVRMASDLPLLVSRTAPGATVYVQVWRAGGVRSLQVTVGELQARPAQAAAPAAPAQRPSGALSEEQVKALNSAARAELALQAGDVVAAVIQNGVFRRLTGYEQALEALKTEQPMTLFVRRGEFNAYLPVVRPKN